MHVGNKYLFGAQFSLQLQLSIKIYDNKSSFLLGTNNQGRQRQKNYYKTTLKFKNNNFLYFMLMKSWEVLTYLISLHEMKVEIRNFSFHVNLEYFFKNNFGVHYQTHFFNILGK